MGDFGIREAFSSMTSQTVLEAMLVILLAYGIIVLVQKLLPRLASKLGGKPRLYLLALVPLLGLLIIVGTFILIVPILIEPSFENMLAIFGALALALGFAFKDYANSLIAGIVILYEMPYRPGDWIEVNGQYGEVRSIGTRAAKIVTADDSVVIIPHNTLWNALIANGNNGSDNLMCVARFHLQPGHNVRQVLDLLRDVAYTSPLTRTWKPVLVTVTNESWGMGYALKAYPLEPRDQFRFVTELTSRASEALQARGIEFVSIPVAAVDPA